MNLPKPVRKVRAPKPLRRAGAPRRSKRVRRATKPRAPRLGTLRDKLWRLFAAYVKERDGSVCFTCDKEGMEGVNWHAGHLVTRRKGSVCYDPLNVHSQCSYCNRHLKGNAAEYAYRFIQRYGREKFDLLMLRSRRTREWKSAEILELIEALQRGGADFECLYEEKYGL